MSGICELCELKGDDGQVCSACGAQRESPAPPVARGSSPRESLLRMARAGGIIPKEAPK